MKTQWNEGSARLANEIIFSDFAISAINDWLIQANYVMRCMTRISQQEDEGILEMLLYIV